MVYPLQMPVFDAATKDIVDPNADGNTYFGTAAPGTATSAPAWQIQRKTVVNGQTIFQYANGDSGFVNVWDNRTGLSYA